jgi:serine/threonine protein kinase
MEYCLSTVNEFLNDIRSFHKRTHIKRKNSMFYSDSSEQDDDLSTGGIRLNSSLDVNEHVRGFVKQLLLALMALHENNIVHCDVKGDNIFIANETGNYIVKLGVNKFQLKKLLKIFFHFRILIYLIDLNLNHHHQMVVIHVVHKKELYVSHLRDTLHRINSSCRQKVVRLRLA